MKKKIKNKKKIFDELFDYCFIISLNNHKNYFVWQNRNKFFSNNKKITKKIISIKKIWFLKNLWLIFIKQL